MKQLSNEFSDYKCAVLVNLENIKERPWSIKDIEVFEDIAFNRLTDETQTDNKVEWQACFLNKRNRKIADLNTTTGFSHTYPVEMDALVKECLKRNLFELREPNSFSKRILKFRQNYFPNLSLTDGQQYECTISKIENLKNIYVNLNVTNNRFEQLNAGLMNCLKNNDLVPLKKFDVDTYCLVKATIRNEVGLYRANILSINADKSTVFVQLIDYGEKLDLEFHHVFHLWSRFYEPCALSLQCRLPYASNIEKCWNEDEEKKFINCFKAGTKVEIKLFSTFEPCLIEFVEKNSIDFKFNSISERLQKSIQLEEPLISPFDYYYLSHVNSFDEIYLHSQRLYSNLETLTNQLNAEQQKPSGQTNFKVGTIIIIKTNLIKEKFVWQRGQIIEVTQEHYHVKLIDYGCIEVVPVEDKDTRLKPLVNGKFIRLPPFAICCKLNNIEEMVNNSREKCQVIEQIHLLHSLQSLVTHNEKQKKHLLNVRFPNEIKGSPLAVDINAFVNDTEISLEELIIRNVIIKSLQLIKFNCLVTHINSHEDFYIQKCSSGPILDVIQPKIDRCSDELVNFEPESLCIASFSLDNQFYRAKILSVNKNINVARVFYIDFGNTDSVNCDMVTKMSEELQMIDKMAFNCKLQFESEQYNTSEKHASMFLELCGLDPQKCKHGFIAFIHSYIQTNF